MTPVFGHGHLRLYLLSLLAESPRHGYELIQALGDRFGGTYVPSAGTIYPRLAKLEDDGLVTKSADGRKTVYAITDAGRAELAAREGELHGIENEVTDSVRRLADEVRTSVAGAMKTLRADLASAARDARTAPREGAADAASDPKSARVESRVQLQRAEVLLAEFRHQLRLELRGTVVAGELASHTVDLLAERLDTTLGEVLASLRATHGKPQENSASDRRE
jgi:DNA-binding PadR family transcriptional regulator